MKILIFGSCVSRDILSFDHSGELKLVDYYARSSLISLNSAPQIVPNEVDNISSEFQRRMVIRDFDKSFFTELAKCEFDILLMDFIDERFDFLSIGNGFVTISNKLVSSGYLSSNECGKVIKRSDEYSFKLWEEAWGSYVEKLIDIGVLHKVRLNIVYWSNRVLQDGVSLNGIDGYSETNARLDRMYSRASKDLKFHQFYRYDESTLVADKDHKWGLSPYHYVKEFYFSGIKNLNIDSMRLLLYNLIDTISFCEIEKLSQSPADESFYNLLDQLGLKKIKSMAVSSSSNKYIDDMLSQFLIRGDLAGFSSSSSDEDRILFSILVGNYNFLVLVESGVLIAIVQHHKFMRGVYLLGSNEFYYYTSYEISQSLFYEFWQEMKRKKELLISSFNNNVIFGSIFSYPRPYHFFYDTLPRFYRFKSLFSGSYSLFSIDEGSFFPLDTKCNLHNFQTSMELNDYCTSRSIVNVNLGYGTRDLFESVKYDEVIKEYSESLVSSELVEKLTSVRSRGCYVIWVGFCNEKRAWKEQLQALRLLHDKLINLGIKPFYIFDGITRNIYGGQDNISLISLEQKLVDDFLDSLSGCDGYYSLIGSAATDKIVCSKYIDFFITSFLTDSMYPARFAKTVGLGFGAKKAVHYEHCHPKTYFVPDELITDIGSGNWSTISCSIDPEYVSAILISIIKGLGRDFAPMNYLGIKNKKSNVHYSFEGESNSISWSLETAEYVRLDKSFYGFSEITRGSYLLVGGKDYLVNLSMENFYTPSFSLHGIVVKDGSRVESFSLYSGSSYIIRKCQSDRFVNFFFRLSGKGSVRNVNISVVPVDEGNGKCLEITPTLDKKILTDVSFDYLDFDTFSNIGTFDLNLKAIQGKIAFRFINRLSDKLIVFFNAAVSRKRGVVPPFFSGSGVTTDLACNVLMISDPSLDRSEELSLGWYIGNESWDVSKAVAEMIKVFKDRFGYNKTILYGGSGGGFAVLKIAEQLEDITVVAANPQTRIFDYDEGSVQRYLDVFFSNHDSRKLGKKDLTSLTRFETEPLLIDESNSVLYLQNVYDSHHVDNHFSFFLSSLGYNVSEMPTDSIEPIGVNKYVLLSTKWGKGHKAPPKEFVTNLLERLLNYPLVDLRSDLHGLNKLTGSLVEEVVLKLNGNTLTVTTNLSTRANEGELLNALYVYCDGVKIEQLGYSKDFSRVIELNKHGVIRVSSFVKGAGQSEVVKSRKVRYGQ